MKEFEVEVVDVNRYVVLVNAENAEVAKTVAKEKWGNPADGDWQLMDGVTTYEISKGI